MIALLQGLERWADVRAVDPCPWPSDVLALVARLDATVAAEASAAMQDELPSLLRRASLQRQYEFLIGRRLARALLCEACGLSGRQPVWPPGMTGSISHIRVHVAVAVAPVGA